MTGLKIEMATTLTTCHENEEQVRGLQLQLRQVQEQNKAEVEKLRIENQMLVKKLELQSLSVGNEIKKAQDQRLRGHLATLRGEIKRAKEEAKKEIINEEFDPRIAAVNRDIQTVHSHIGLIPFTFTMPQFEQKKSEDVRWYSPSFYTHPRGYRMCLAVDANGCGDGKDSHVSVFIFLMKGEYDESLNWPFRANVTIQLLNQISMEHLTRTIPFNDCASIDNAGSRVTIREQAGSGMGFHNFVSHANLRLNYLINDSLCLCVKDVKLTSV